MVETYADFKHMLTLQIHTQLEVFREDIPRALSGELRAD